jgi:tetratricopeptide (TPR) repeat protein
LRKAGEVFAFDSYWAEARDNLKVLDPKFSELSDIKEFMVEATPFKYSETQKPAELVKELRYQLFDLASGAAVDEGAQPQGEAAVPSNPALAKSVLRLAGAHLALNQPREAVIVCSHGLRRAAELKKSAQVWTLLGYAYQAQGLTRESLTAFEEAGKADPKVVEPLLNAVAVTLRSLDFENSVRLLDEVLRREPGHYWATVTRAVALRRVSAEPEKAKAALQSLAELADKESRPEVHYNRCVIAQSVLTGSKAATQEALGICQKSLDAVGSKAAVAKELRKRVDGLKATLEFMSDDGATPPKPAAPEANPEGQGAKSGSEGGANGTQPTAQPKTGEGGDQP